MGCAFRLQNIYCSAASSIPSFILFCFELRPHHVSHTGLGLSGREHQQGSCTTTHEHLPAPAHAHTTLPNLLQLLFRAFPGASLTNPMDSKHGAKSFRWGSKCCSGQHVIRQGGNRQSRRLKSGQMRIRDHGRQRWWWAV